MKEEDDLVKKKRFTTPEQIKFAKKPILESERESSQKPVKLNISLKPRGPSKKLTLRPEDIKLSLKSKIEKIRKDRRKITVKSAIKEPSKQEAKQLDEITTVDELDIEPVEYPEHDVNLTDVIMTYGEFDFSKELQKLIIKRGSTLKAELCEKFIDEMLESLEAALKYEDLKYAAEIFVKIERSL